MKGSIHHHQLEVLILRVENITSIDQFMKVYNLHFGVTHSLRNKNGKSLSFAIAGYVENKHYCPVLYLSIIQ